MVLNIIKVSLFVKKNIIKKLKKFRIKIENKNN